MELASTAFLIFMGIAFGLATLLGIIWGETKVHSLILLALWVTVAGGIFGSISLGFWTHIWINTFLAPVAPPVQPAEAVPDASSDKQPAAPDPDTRPLHEHPTPEYIAQIISETDSASLDDITRRFIGKDIAWDGRIAGKEPSGDHPWILVRPGLDKPVGSRLPENFFVKVEHPDHAFLLILPDGTPIHVDGTIDSFNIRAPEIKLKAVRTLPDSQGME